MPASLLLCSRRYSRGKEVRRAGKKYGKSGWDARVVLPDEDGNGGFVDAGLTAEGWRSRPGKQ
jgi:hypothetical protein